MTNRFDFDEQYMDVPAAAVDANPAQTIRELMFRVSKLEHDLAEKDAVAAGDISEVMLDLVGLSDELTAIVQRWGIATNAQEAALVKAVDGLEQLQQVLAKQQVKPVSVIGQPFNAQTSEMQRVKSLPRCSRIRCCVR